MSKIITDEQELNTAIGDLVTEDYALEILGLQSIADFRKFSRSFMKLSKIVKEVETNVDNNLDEKLNKGAVSSDYDTAKKIEDKIKGIDEKFKNFCPFPVNSLYISLGNENPSSLWLGTTWQKQENRFLLGAGSSYNLGATGGSSAVTLSVANLPSHNHSASTASHTHSQPAHQHSGSAYKVEGENGAVRISSSYANNYVGKIYVDASGGDTTGSASPITTIGNTGNGQSFSIMPPYIAVNIWKRTS